MSEESTKFCVLPGQQPVRIARTDGRVVLIGEEPRTIPLDMHGEAISKGAVSESAMAALAQRMKEQTAPPEINPPNVLIDEKADERAASILQATIDILNTGNPDDLTAHGKPKVEAIEVLCGFDIKSAERDAAFDTAQKG